MRRREFCALAWGAAAPVAAAAEGDAEARLGVLCQLGSEEARARRVLEAARAAGFRRVAVNFAWDRVTEEFLRGLPRWIEGLGLECEVLGAYVNCVAPEMVLMSTRREDFERAVEYAGALGCARLVAWTGSRANNLFATHPRNATRESEDALVRFVEGQLKRLERQNVTLALETYVTLTCPDARSLRRVLERLPERVGAVMDPPNLTPVQQYRRRDAALREMMRLLGPRVKVVHLKDFRLKADASGYELPGPLGGEMNYPLYLELLGKLGGELTWFAEHIEPEEFQATREKLLALARKALRQ